MQDVAVELFWGKRIAAAVPTEPERPNKGKQTKSMHVLEGVRPPKFLAERVIVNEEVVMEERDGSGIPRVTGQAACAETACIVREICDNRFNDLRGKLGEWGRARRKKLRGSTPGAHPPDRGLASVPNSFGEYLDHCGGGHDYVNGAMRSARVVRIPDNEDVGVFFVGIAFLLQGVDFCF